jgi:hypothetical protein
MIAVLVGAAILAFPLSLLVNKINGTQSDTSAIRDQASHIAAQQEEIATILGQVNGLGLENRKLLCSFGAFVVEQPIAKLVNESEAAFESRLTGYQNVLHDLRRVDCQATLHRTHFQREVRDQTKQINQALSQATGGSGGSGHSGGHVPGQNPGQNQGENHTPGTNTVPAPGTPGGTDTGTGDGGSGGGGNSGDPLTPIVNGANGLIDGVQQGLNNLLQPHQP